VKLTNYLVKDAMKIAGMDGIGSVTVVPLATGMALTATLLALRGQRPSEARYVVWSRVDQKTCVKAITSAGLEVVTVPVKLDGEQLTTDVDAMAETVRRLGPEAVACIITTTSCFAPRAADDVVAAAKLAESFGVGHIINNAYGVQSADICKKVSTAWRRGRVDAVVQSTDKNFMVPVGGAVIASGRRDGSLVEAVNRSYPGRASMSPLLDLLMTMLHLGEDGWRALLSEREDLYCHAKSKLSETAAGFGEHILESPGNPISIAVSLGTISETGQVVGTEAGDKHLPITFLGSMLWSRCISGARVIGPGKTQIVSGIKFNGFGSSHDAYPCAYLTAAAAIGTSKEDIDNFCSRLSKCVNEFRSKYRTMVHQG